MGSRFELRLKSHALSIVGACVFSAVGAQNVQDTAMEKKDSIRDLQEVTVTTALGIKRLDRNIGYSVQSVKGSELTTAREPNALSGLTGKVAGLTIGTSAEMLGRPQVVLRGNTDLLYVIDGVPVNSDSWNISPDDIETYSVLKGPNAAALYGFRGQNGAIVITTRRGNGKKHGWSVNVNTSQMLEHGFLAIPISQSEYGRGGSPNYAYQFAQGYTYGKDGTDVRYDNFQRLPIWGPRFEGQSIKQYDSPYDLKTGVRSKTPWVARGKDNLRNFLEDGLLSTNNISAAAGGDNYTARISYTHMYQKGMAPNTRLNADNLNLLTSFSLTPKLSAEANLNLNVQYTPNIPDVAYGPNSYVYEFGVYGSADFDIRDLKDYYGGNGGVKDLQQNAPEYGRMNNPYFQAAKWLRGHYKTDIYGYIKLNYRFNDDLNLMLRSQVTTWNQSRTEKVPASANLNDYLPAGWFTFGQYNGDYREDKRTVYENNSDLLLTYNKKIDNDWHLNGLLGGSWRSYKYNSSYATTQNLSIPGIYGLQNSKGSIYAYNYDANMMVYSGYYSIDFGHNKYINLNTTGRVDNTSTLIKGNNTFFYPSVALSSMLSDYLPLPSFVSYLKVRGSYADVKSAFTRAYASSAFTMNTGTSISQNIKSGGLLGYGADITTPYDGPTYSNQMVGTNVTYWNGTPSALYSTTVANSNIKPADNKSYELGVDASFWRKRATLNATYFVSDAGPQIFQLPLASSTTYINANVNGITTQKKGWEISLNVVPVKNPDGLTWDATFNWSTYKERLKDIYEGQEYLTLNGHNYRKGERMDALYGTYLVKTPDGQVVHASNGSPLYNTSTNIDDQKFLGYMNPDFTFGITNNFNFKNFNFSFQFDGRIGGKIYDYVWAQMMNGGTAQELVKGKMGAARLAEWNSTNNASQAPSGAYVGDGVVVTAGMPVIKNGVVTNMSDLKVSQNTTPILLRTYASALYNTTEAFMVDRSFAKLRQVTLGYTFPQSAFKNGAVKGLSISLVGRNLLYFAARKDFDIDQYASGYNFSDNSLNTGRGVLQSPTTRRYGINVNVSF